MPKRPTPTEVLKLRGSWRANTRPDEPKPKAGRPKCPTWLCPVAKKKWAEIVPLLHDAGIVTLADRDVLTLYCDTFAMYEALSREVAGSVPDRLTVATMKNLAQTLTKLATELGMTPTSRPRIPVREEPMDPIADEFFGPG